MAPSRRTPGLRCAGLAAVAFFLILIGRFWHPVYGFTSLLQLDASQDRVKIAAFRDYPVYVHRDTGPYDGLYYAQLAYHPLLTAPELAPAMDSYAYRARRILAPALAWVLAGGRPARIARVYAELNLFAWLALAGLLWRLLPVRDTRSACAWAGILFSAGALASVRFALTDLVALVFLAGAMLAWERDRPGRAAGWLALAALSRETSLAAFPAMAERPWISRANFRRALLAAVPLVAWIIYVRWRTGSGEQPWGNFTWPLVSLVAKGHATLLALRAPEDPLLAWTTLLAFVGLMVQAVSFARPRPADPWWRLGATYAVMMLFLGAAVWDGFPGAALRVLLPLTLAFNVQACRRPMRWAWLLAGNLTVFAGLLTFTDVPTDSTEIAAAHRGGRACLVHVGSGWFNREHTWRHTWWWSGGAGVLTVETWPRTDQRLALALTLRSLTPRLVTIREGGRECWRGEVGPAKVPVEIAVEVQAGRAELEVASPTPGVPENGTPEARALAFALYDPRIIGP